MQPVMQVVHGCGDAFQIAQWHSHKHSMVLLVSSRVCHAYILQAWYDCAGTTSGPVLGNAGDEMVREAEIVRSMSERALEVS